MGYTTSLIHGDGKNRYQCDDCPVFFWDEEDMVSHVYLWHNGYAISDLSKPLDGTASFVGHFGKTTPDRPIPLDQVDARMEQAGREIQDLHDRMDKVFATLNSGKSAQEAAYQKGRREALSEAYDELMRAGLRVPAAIVRGLDEGF